MKSIKFWVIGVLLIAVLAGGALFVFNFTNQAPDWQEQYDLGLRKLSEGQFREAVLLFDAAISLDPQNPQGYLSRAEAYIGLGDYEAARRDLEAAKPLIAPGSSLWNKLDSLGKLLPNGDDDAGLLVIPTTAETTVETTEEATVATEEETEPTTEETQAPGKPTSGKPNSGKPSGGSGSGGTNGGSNSGSGPSHSDQVLPDDNSGSEKPPIDVGFPDEGGGTSHNPLPDIEPDNDDNVDLGQPDDDTVDLGQPNTGSGPSHSDQELPDIDDSGSHTPPPIDAGFPDDTVDLGQPE